MTDAVVALGEAFETLTRMLTELKGAAGEYLQEV